MRLRLVATPTTTALADHAKAVNQASWHRDGCTAPRHNRVFAAATGLAPGTAAATPPSLRESPHLPHNRRCLPSPRVTAGATATRP
jgi:hypothetical protein